MTNLFSNEIRRMLLGFDGLFNTIEYSNGAYPPYNIVYPDKNSCVIELALAGWKKENITITLNDKLLVVEGKPHTDEPSLIEGKNTYYGIAKRKFKHKYSIADGWKVDNAQLQDGLLTITLSAPEPEEKKSTVIEIN